MINLEVKYEYTFSNPGSILAVMTSMIALGFTYKDTKPLKV